jgi:starvation-inducible DNA-binding protein
MDELRNALKITFASEFSFYLKSHYFHWNVEGMFFKQFHDLFGDIYEEVQESIDVFAEQIRSVGGYVPGSFERFSVLSRIDDETSVPSADDMTRILLEDSEKMAKLFQTVFKIAEAQNEQGLCDFLAARLDAHRKHSWMLRATLK